MSEVDSAPRAPFGKAYRAYALGLLVVVYVFNFIDRSILGILVQPIKEDLGASDTMMGFLGGIAFATFYTFMGIPLARMADKGSRRNVLAVCLALWSGATALCGLAQTFFHLLLARIGVAVGEAGGSPSSHSMISDMYEPDRRATALAIYALGIPIGTMLGNLGGGWQAISNPVVTYDWEADSSNKLNLPLGGGIAKTFKIGRMPLRLTAEVQYFVASTDRFGPDWLYKFSLSPIMPSKHTRH